MSTDWTTCGKRVLDVEIEALQTVRQNLGESFSVAVDLLASCPGRVVVTGIGKSGLVGRKIAATLSSTGTPAYFLHPVEGAHGDLGAVYEKDVVIAISNSGNTDELNAILPALRSLGTKIIALTAGLDSPLAKLSDVVIDCRIPREACPMDLAPTSSTTAALALGDALAVCLIEFKHFTPNDFKRYHPGGSLGQRLSLKVADIMHTGDLPVIPFASTVKQALAALDAGRLGAVIMVDDSGKLEGILTDGDIRRLVWRGGLDLTANAQSIMSTNPKYAQPDQSAAELMDMMEQQAITVLPVVDASRMLVGVIHMHDLLGKGKIRFAQQI